MTFKAIFEQNNFDIQLYSDFCVILAKSQKPWYVVYKNMGLRCLDLFTFKDISVSELSRKWKIDNSRSDTEDYELTFSIDKTYMINYIFGLIPFDNEICSDIPNYDYWENSLAVRKEENKPALLMSDMERSYCNVLIFDSDSYRLLLPNTNCYLLKENGQKYLLVSYSPLDFLNYISTIDIDNFATSILPINVSECILRSLIADHFDSYDFICSGVKEYIEVLRFCCCYINYSGMENIHLSFSSGKGEISFFVLPDATPLKYIQLSATMQRELRSLIGIKEPIDSFRVTKKDILKTKVISILFDLSFGDMEVLINNIIKAYNLPCRIF